MGDNLDVREKVSQDVETTKNIEVKELPKQGENGIAMEIFGTLKKVLLIQWVVIGVLILIIAAQSFYHDYKWSQYETVVVDSGDGGNANYIGNDGDISNYGEGNSSQEEESER